jgi:hypothetical protein
VGDVSRKPVGQIPGPADWTKMHAKALTPKSREEQEALVRKLTAAGYTLAQTALIAKLSLNEVKKLLGIPIVEVGQSGTLL